jgi:branched-chain amino acid transport system substrate-binding protein
VFGYESIKCAATAIEKAGGTDKEKIVDALTGMRFNSPRGEMNFRDYQNIASGKVYVGKTYKDPGYPFYIYKDIIEVPPEKTWLSIEEVKKLRGE